MNPIIWRKGICDPHIKIFNDRAYLYATHDQPGNDGFCMTDWQIWSSENLVDWKLETTMNPEDFYCGDIDQCWAVDAAYKNGKYYWYFSTGSWGVGVGVSDSPCGPFTDALGKALVDFSTPPAGVQKWDPCVFQDDDGNSYLIVGSCLTPAPDNQYLIAKLNEDMVSLSEPLRRIAYINNPCEEDKASIHKHGDIYYLTHSSYYAISDNVYGPYTHIGNTGCNIDHGSYFTYKNQNYFASGGMDNPDRYFRSSYLAPCHYLPEHKIVIEQKCMEYGVGQYDGNWETIHASWFFAASNPHKIKSSQDRIVMSGIRSGDSFFYPNINNVAENAEISFCAAALSDGNRIEIRESTENGNILGICEIANTGSMENYMIFTCQLKNTAGIKQIYLCIRGTQQEELLRLDWFAFNRKSSRYTMEPHMSKVGWGARIMKDKNASCGMALRNLYVKDARFRGLADGKDGGEALLRIRYATPHAGVYLNLYVNGNFAKKIIFEATGSFHMAKIPAVIKTKIELIPGVNEICLVSDKEYQVNGVNIDNMEIEMENSSYQTYSAANAVVVPEGNGCWDNLPQRENDPLAFSGRAVKYLNIPGSAVVFYDVDGGAGGPKTLVFRYCKKGLQKTGYELWINDSYQTLLELKGTVEGTFVTPEKCAVSVDLLPGKNNIIRISKSGPEEDGIWLDALSIISSVIV